MLLFVEFDTSPETIAKIKAWDMEQCMQFYRENSDVMEMPEPPIGATLEWWVDSILDDIHGMWMFR
jgi:hypothetical protein